MDRLYLGKPRATRLKVLPLSAPIPLGVHWHYRSWVCAEESGRCDLCELVPRRGVVYFAAAIKTPSKEGPADICLLERSAAWYHAIERQLTDGWNDSLGKLCVLEKAEGRERTIETVGMFEEQQPYDLVPVHVLAFSVAALYRCPQFPRCTTIGNARRALQAFSARQQTLLLSGGSEVQ